MGREGGDIYLFLFMIIIVEKKGIITLMSIIKKRAIATVTNINSILTSTSMHLCKNLFINNN